jgi:hypothetical protein
VGALNYVCLNQKILGDKVDRIRAIREDAANFCGSQKNILGPVVGEKAVNFRLIREVQFRMRA